MKNDENFYNSDTKGEYNSLKRFAKKLGYSPPLRGTFLQSEKNFYVEEIPSYLPIGQGEHLFIKIRKRNISTKKLINILQKELKLNSADIGYAGLKDTSATAVQWLSLRGVTPDRLRQLSPLKESNGDESKKGNDERPNSPGEIEILQYSYHKNKLKIGHLRGNRFVIKLSEISEIEREGLFEALTLLRAKGLPNFFGPQRLGRDNSNAYLGKELIFNRKNIKKWKRKFLISAYQSFLFNKMLANRIEGGYFDTVLEGDILHLHRSGGKFVCREPKVDIERFKKFEISPTGPMFGHKVELAEGLPGEWELELLKEEGLELELFKKFGKEGRGTRRPYRVPLEVSVIQDSENSVHLDFILPPGSYASVLLELLGMAFVPGKVSKS